MDSPKRKDLPDIRNYFFDKAELCWRTSFWLAFIAQFLLLLAIWIENNAFLLIVAIFGVLLPITMDWLRELASDYFFRGDKCRRLILYSDGLGKNITREDLLEIQSWVMKQQINEAPYKKPYYASILPHGPNRLADITAESAFFTEKLSEKAIDRLWLALIISLLLLLGILLGSDLYIKNPANTDGVLENITKSAALIVAFLISGDFAVLLKKYYSLRDSSKNVFRNCIRLRSDQATLALDVIMVVEDYHLSLIQSPPIPSRLYIRYRDDLNEIYRDTHLLK